MQQNVYFEYYTDEWNAIIYDIQFKRVIYIKKARIVCCIFNCRFQVWKNQIEPFFFYFCFRQYNFSEAPK